MRPDSRPVKTPQGRLLRIADLVDDDPKRRDRISAALKDPAQKNNRDYVDVIIALGMAKEGFDWIWCDHVLTVGYRSSLTEIVQIIGRATRDAPGQDPDALYEPNCRTGRFRGSCHQQRECRRGISWRCGPRRRKSFSS